MEHALNSGVDNVGQAEAGQPGTDKSKASNKRGGYSDSITVSPEAFARLQLWADMIRDRMKGVRVTRNELVSWLILREPEQLPPEALADLQARFFDEVRFAQWAVDELRAAKARGEKVTFAEILERSGHPASIASVGASPVNPRRKRTKAQVESLLLDSDVSSKNTEIFDKME